MVLDHYDATGDLTDLKKYLPMAVVNEENGRTTFSSFMFPIAFPDPRELMPGPVHRRRIEKES